MLATRNIVKKVISTHKCLCGTGRIGKISQWNFSRCLSTPGWVFSEINRKIAEHKQGADYEPIKPPEYFNFARDILDQWAQLDKTNAGKGVEEPLAFWFVTKDGTKIQWTYSDISRESQKVANCLAKLGANKTWTRSLLLLPKIPEWWLINIACIRLGVELVLSTSLISPKDLEYRLHTSKSQCVITDPRLAEAVDSVEQNCPNITTKILVSDQNTSRNDWKNFDSTYKQALSEHTCANTKSGDKMQIFFTSGTSGLPKRVAHCHAGLGLATLYLGRYVFLLDRRSVFWNLADTGWSKTAMSSLFSPLVAGATIFLHAMPQFDPAETIRTLENYPIDLTCAPPTVYRMLLTQKIPKLKSMFFSAGEALNPEVVVQWEAKTGQVIRQGYGQTETPPLLGTRLNHPFKLGTMGKPNKVANAQILDDNYQPAPVGVVGHIAVPLKPERPVGLFLEYEDEPEKTAATEINGYYITGDRAHMDEEGYFWFHSRADDVITTSAYRVGPFEVESALQGHPDVLESGVIGSPDPIRGEVVKAFVVLRDSGKEKDPLLLISELQEFCKKTTGAYKYPRKIEFVDSLPKTISGKIKRAELRQKEMETLNKMW